jgi:uncharacterized protein
MPEKPVKFARFIRFRFVMQSGKIEVKIDAMHYASGRKSTSGSVALARMEMLAKETVSLDGDAFVSMEFSRDADNYILIDLHLQANLQLLCQRCMQPFEYKVDVKRTLSPIGGESNRLLPEQYEPCKLEDGFVFPQHIVEDELILSLPVVAKHENVDCAKHTDRAYYASNDLVEQVVKKENPFKILAQIKN